MRTMARTRSAAAAIGVLIAAVPLTVHAQGAASGAPMQSTVRAPVMPPAPPQQQPITIFAFDGTPIHVWSPIQQPYAGTAYQTFHGQPMRGGDTLLTPGAMGP